MASPQYKEYPYPQQPYPQQPYPQQPYPQQPYPQQPYPQQPPSPPPPPLRHEGSKKRSSNDKRDDPFKNMFFYGLITVIVIVILAWFFLFNISESKDEEPITKTMTVKEFIEDYDIISNEYRSLKPGDTVIIEDKIFLITGSKRPDFLSDSNKTVTFIWFESTHQGNYSQYWYDYDRYFDIYYGFNGDLTSELNSGDSITITFHIINYELVPGVVYESIEEFDEEYNQLFQPDAINLVSHAENGTPLNKVLILWISLFNETDGYNYIFIENLNGDPLNISNYKIIITDTINKTNKKILTGLTGKIGFDERLFYTDNSSYSIPVYVPELEEILLRTDDKYIIEIYDINDNMQVYNRQTTCS